jgi:hypothetical protein
VKITVIAGASLLLLGVIIVGSLTAATDARRGNRVV